MQNQSCPIPDTDFAAPTVCRAARSFIFVIKPTQDVRQTNEASGAEFRDRTHILSLSPEMSPSEDDERLYRA